MKYLTVSLFALLVAASYDDAPQLSWQTELAVAADKAADQKKLILVRQILCECSDEECRYADLARSPWYLGDEKRRAKIGKNFIPIVIHSTPAKARDPFKFDPNFEGLKDAKASAPIRTVFLTPTLHVLHRLDLCDRWADIDGEIDYVLKTAESCYRPNGKARYGGMSRLMDLQEEHFKHPERFHKRRGTPRPASCKCSERKTGLSGSTNTWEPYYRGIVWHSDVDEARNHAKESNKPLLYWQVVGDLNKEGC